MAVLLHLLEVRHVVVAILVTKSIVEIEVSTSVFATVLETLFHMVRECT